MNTPKNFDVAIIGGGMVGASLALLLARKNPAWQIALLEARPFLETTKGEYESNFDARSTAIASGSVDILRKLGVWEQLAKQATAIAQVHISDAGHFMGGLIDASTYHLDAVGYVVPNLWVGRVLFAQLQQQENVQFFAPVNVEKLIPLQKGTQLFIRSAEELVEINCKLAVVADGSASLLANTLGIERTVKDYGQIAIIASVACSEPHKGIAYERFTEQGPLALLPMGGSKCARESALVLTLSAAEANTIIELSDADFLQHLQQRFGHRLGKFLRVSQRYSYPLKLITANEQIRSHIVLVGNAAHFLHPVAGQGFNLSLRDCVCLVDALTQGEAAKKSLGELSVLQDYLRRQQIDQTLTIEFSDKLIRLFSSSALPLIVLRHLGFMGLDLAPAVKRQFAAQTMGTAGIKFL